MEAEDEFEIEWSWDTPEEGRCPEHGCNGVLHDASLDVLDPLGGHGYEWRQCGRCRHITSVRESD